MGRKRRGTSSRQGLSFGFTVLALVILAALYMAREALGVDLGPLDDLLPTLEGDGGPVAGDGGGVSGDYYDLYFTSPRIPDDDVRSGGLDEVLAAAIDGAQTSVDIAAFEFELDSMADALIAAQQRGVRVRMVDDDEQTEDSEPMERVRDAGIPVVDDERSAFMHNKFIVIDGREVWAGSMNFTPNGVYRNNNNLIRITSPELATNYTTEFEEMFNQASFGPTSPVNTPNQRITVNGVRIENYFSPEDGVMDRIRAQTARAESSIHFMAFSYTDFSLAEVMMDRGANGVEVRGIFEVRGANTQFSECNTLLDAGLDVRLDGNPATFHHKVIIVDSSVVITGSFNYSDNATNSNDENLLIIHDPAVASEYEAEFNARWVEAQLPVGGRCRTS